MHDNLDTATTKRCLETARRAAVQLQIATIDAYRILSRADHVKEDSRKCLQLVWRHALTVEDVLVEVAKDTGITWGAPF
jgi:hypothetical protein